MWQNVHSFIETVLLADMTNEGQEQRLKATTKMFLGHENIAQPHKTPRLCYEI